jgi:hypothetical protein
MFSTFKVILADFDSDGDLDLAAGNVLNGTGGAVNSSCCGKAQIVRFQNLKS